jgi:Leucine-rich repeat (LRR) protein
MKQLSFFLSIFLLNALVLYANVILNRDQLKSWFPDFLTDKNLILSDRNIKSINSDTFIGLNLLQILSINNNEIEIFDSNLFDDLVNLNGLILGPQQQSSAVHPPLDTLLFDKLINLDNLDLTGLNLDRIDKLQFKQLSKLKSLTLNENKISLLDSSVFNNIINIERLWIASNELNYLSPDLFNGLVKLYWLDLSTNKLTSLDKTIFKSLDNLQDLNLAENYLQFLDKNLFNNLTKLTYLYLNGNKLMSLDRTIFVGLNMLKEVHVQENPISIVKPDSVGLLCRANPYCQIYIK